MNAPARKTFSELAEEGKIQPIGPRVLLRAVMPHDKFEAALTEGVPFDARDAEAFVVVALGDVPLGLVVGQRVHLRTTAATRVDIHDKQCRYWYVHVDDVMGKVLD